MTYRVDHHQPQNVYRNEQYIGVMFTAEDAARVVYALRFAAQDLAAMPPHPTCADVSTLGQRHGTTWVCTVRCPRADPAASATAPDAPARDTER